MNDQDVQAGVNGQEDGDKNPLQFWAAYVPGAGTKRNYLGDGKGNVRLFKSEEAMRKHLQNLVEMEEISAEFYETIVVHPVEGKLALPDDLQQPIKIPFRGVLNSPNHLKPIITLHKPTVPTVVELLEDYTRRKKRKRRH